MTPDSRVVALLRSAIPPVAPAGPARDMWPLVVSRSQQRPKWSWLDFGLAAGAALALWTRPDLLMLLAYYF